MHIVTGATGHVGSGVVLRLLAEGAEVLAIAHRLLDIPKLKLAGANVEMVDIRDIAKLTSTFSRGESLFMLNPPADISGDSVADEKQTVRCLIQALSQSTVERIVAESTQGARPGEGIGDLGVLHSMEEELRNSGRAVRITRAGFYMSNWDLQARTVRETGVLQSFFPAAFKIPMVAPDDLGDFNAEQMMRSFSGFQITDVSGPEDYCAQDIANEFARIFQREVRVDVTPREKWIETYKQQGFSAVSANSYAEMTRLTLESGELPNDPVRGETSLRDYFEKTYGPQPAVARVIDSLRL